MRSIHLFSLNIMLKKLLGLKHWQSITHYLSMQGACVLCQTSTKNPTMLCSFCNSLLQIIPYSCARCSLPLPTEQFHLCGNCIRHPPSYDKIYTHYIFVEPLRSLIHQYKYHHALHLRRLLMHWLLEAWSPEMRTADCIIPVPMHPSRLKQRGFNQSTELAKRLAKTLNLPFEQSLCRKIKPTVPQVGLNAQQRQHNLRNSFQTQATTYQHILVIDDLVTTGITADLIASSLKEQGVKRVDIWCCARAIPTHSCL